MAWIPRCPVCREIDDCEHRLVEWYGWPGERLRGSLCDLLRRMEASVGRLVVECCVAGVAPRHPGLRAAFDAGVEIVADPELDEETLRSEVDGEVTEFVIECLRAAPGVTVVVDESPVVANPEPCDYVSLFAADPVAVRQHLLDLLAPLEVQLDQFYFERGESPPRGRQTEEAERW